MQEPWDENLKKDIEKFLYSLQNENNEFHFYPVLEGVTITENNSLLDLVVM